MSGDKWGQSKYTVVLEKLLYIYSDPIYLIQRVNQHRRTATIQVGHRALLGAEKSCNDTYHDVRMQTGLTDDDGDVLFAVDTVADGK